VCVVRTVTRSVRIPQKILLIAKPKRPKVVIHTLIWRLVEEFGSHFGFNPGLRLTENFLDTGSKHVYIDVYLHGVDFADA